MKYARKIDREDQISDGAQSIRRALDILDILAAEGTNGMRLTEIARTTGLTPSTVHRILHVLVARNVVEQNHATRRYAVGEQIPMLALARPNRSILLQTAEPYLQQAAKELGDTLYLTVRVGLDALCVARIFGTYPIQVVTIQIGARRPLGVSAAGVAMLASLPKEEAHSIIKRNRMRLEKYNVTSSQVDRTVETARKKGYFLRQKGIVEGTRALSVPIPSTTQTPLSALTIGAVDRRLTYRREAEVVEFLNASAKRIRKALPR